MHHTLKSLYENINAKHPDLTAKFRLLEDYCFETGSAKTDFLNTGHKSLKWLIYGLRDELHPGELQDLFYNLLAEAAAHRGEEWLYADINRFRNAKPYIRQIHKPIFDIDDWPVIEIYNLRTLINTTAQNITNLVFRDDWADMIIVRSPDRSGAYILNFGAAEKTDITPLFQELDQRNEGWIKINNNLLLCGGKKEPHNQTSLTINDLIELAKKHLNP